VCLVRLVPFGWGAAAGAFPVGAVPGMGARRAGGEGAEEPDSGEHGRSSSARSAPGHAGVNPGQAAGWRNRSV
jgi:hypothetical protein